MCLCAKRALSLHRIASVVDFLRLNAKRNKKSIKQTKNVPANVRSENESLSLNSVLLLM